MIHPTRGIHHGDPLSPFLFLLCTESLNSLILKAANEGSIDGFALSRKGPKLTHFSLQIKAFCFAGLAGVNAKKFWKFWLPMKACRGKKINRGKTSIFFSKSTTKLMRAEIKDTLGVSELRHYEKYLGLPSPIGRHKKASFDYIKERVWTKLQGWEEKLLSQVGREVLIKTVVQVIPTYTMGCFKLLIGLCNEIEKLIRRFWWG